MKQNILRPRGHLAMVIMMLGMLLSVQTAFATRSFTLSGDKNVSLTQPANKYWSFTDIVPDTLHLSITLISSDPSIKISPSGNIVIAPDSIGQKYGGVVLSYSGNTATVSTSYIIITDGNGTTDSIVINAQDDRFHNSSKPFNVYATNVFTYDEDSTLYFYYTQQKASVDLQAANYSGSPIEVSVSLTNSSGNFSLDETSFTIGAPGGAVGTHNFHLNFEATTGHYQDSVLIIMQTKGANPISDTLKILALDSTNTIDPFIPCDTLMFLDQAFGTTECGWIYIVNPHDYAISLSNIDESQWPDNTCFITKTPISLPLTIAAHSSDSIEVCFTAPKMFGTSHNIEFYITYSGPGTKSATSSFIGVGTTKDCLSAKSNIPSIYNINFPFEATIVGGYTDMTTSFTNNTDGDIVITDLNHKLSNGNGDDYVSLVSPTLPFTIASGKEFDLTLRFAPTDYKNYYNYVTWSLSYSTGKDSLCSSTDWFYSYGLVLDPNDTGRHTLYSGEIQVLPMQSSQNTTSKTFRFYNDWSTSVKVSGLSLRDGKHFSISSPNASDLPITVASNAYLDVVITFDASSNGFYTDSLIIITDKALTSQTFHIQAIRTGVAAVEVSAKTAASISIVPNPAEAMVTIRSSGIEKATMEIFDELGNSIAKHSGSEWLFNTNDASLSVAKGNYFIRTSGIGSDGTSIVQTKRLVIR